MQCSAPKLNIWTHQISNKASLGGYTGKQGNNHLQLLQLGLDIRKFEEDCCVRDAFVVQQKANPPDDRREAHILDASQIVEDDFWFQIVGHFAPLLDGFPVKTLRFLPVSDQNQCSNLGCIVYTSSQEHHDCACLNVAYKYVEI